MTYNETDLLHMLSEGSEYAFRELFQTHKNKIYKVALAYVKSPAIAEEVVQDVFLKVWLHRENLRDVKSFESWVHTVGKNQIVNRYKRTLTDNKMRAEYQQQSISAEDNQTFSRVLDKEYERILQKGLSLLSTQQREIYRLVKERGYTYKEAAEILNISPLTVKTHLARAMNFLRNYIKEAASLCIFYLLKDIL